MVLVTPTLLLISAALLLVPAALTSLASADTPPQPANLQALDEADVTAASWNQAHLRLRELADRCSPTLGPISPYMSIALLLLGLLSLGLVNSQFHGRRNALSLPSVGLGLFTMVFFTAASYFLFAALAPDCAAGVPTTTGQLAPSTVKWMASSSSPVFTVPASADFGMNVLPNVKDPDAVDPQHVCPGYKATNVENTASGFTADLRLAGQACNVYGNDIEDLTLLVKFQTADRIHLQIQPRYMGPQNESWFLLPEVLVPSPPDTSFPIADHPLEVSWSNEPSFWFSVTRKDNGDTLFTTEGRALVFEDQFFEFGSPLPENYNLYGLGETIHGFRLGNNLTSKSPPPLPTIPQTHTNPPPQEPSSTRTSATSPTPTSTARTPSTSTRATSPNPPPAPSPTPPTQPTGPRSTAPSPTASTSATSTPKRCSSARRASRGAPSAAPSTCTCTPGRARRTSSRHTSGARLGCRRCSSIGRWGIISVGGDIRIGRFCRGWWTGLRGRGFRWRRFGVS